VKYTVTKEGGKTVLGALP